MTSQLKDYWLNQLEFLGYSGLIMRILMALQGALPRRIPELTRDLESIGQMVKLLIKRERAFPIVVKERPYNYRKADKKAHVA
ncbi:transposase [Pectobacterium betavasculorum]|nr:transposase [Pectobacterium betavasculorum]